MRIAEATAPAIATQSMHLKLWPCLGSELRCAGG
jgi:hypothetical protein